MNGREEECDPTKSSICGQSGCRAPSRRDFLKVSGFAAAVLAAQQQRCAAANADEQQTIAGDHFVPIDKKLDPQWVRNLTLKGEQTWYSGADLKTIAMPIGGICAGQIYLGGDGRLLKWDIFNRNAFEGYGQTSYNVGRTMPSPLAQGFAVHVTSAGRTLARTLDQIGFPKVRFSGEYPLGFVEYTNDDFPIAVRLEAFSPFIPLNASDSAIPAVVMSYTLTNTSATDAQVMLAGWLQNGVCLHSGEAQNVLRSNQLQAGNGYSMVRSEAKPGEPPKNIRPPRVLADFEGEDYGDWKAEGDAFGAKPAYGSFPNQQEVSGFEGKGLVNTYRNSSDSPRGKLVSPPFTIDRRFLSFLIGGGKDAAKTGLRLLIDGKVVRHAGGQDSEKLNWRNWFVAEWEGCEARIEIIDESEEAWGHINVDQIELRDKPRSEFSGPIDKQHDFGTMGIAVMGDSKDIIWSPSLPLPLKDVSDNVEMQKLRLLEKRGRRQIAAVGDYAQRMFTPGGLAVDGNPQKSFDEVLVGAVGKKIAIKPGETATVSFVLTWSFPNRAEGNFYATRFPNAQAATTYVVENNARLQNETRLWHKTWYDATLPHWLLDRLFSTVSILATNTCHWWGNGRFWAWEGVGCCHGTCAHVWNYEHAMARLFPQLERSVREMQDYDKGFVEESGMVRFRGENWGMWAGDGQAGTVLKAYREHLVSADDQFLTRNWAKIKKALEFLLGEDANDDGLLEGKQHNTYDIDFYGANTMVGSLYLGALRAGEQMAKEQGDEAFAARCRKVFDSGSRLSVDKLFNGEYFTQTVDLQKHPQWQYGDGCLADHLFGQSWAWQVALGYLYPKDKVQSALKAIWKYDWAPDVGPQNKAHPPERWFARPGEAGLFICTWPHGKHMGPKSVRYRNEVWTGIEYQVAGHMAWEGMLTEALAICRAIYDRYHPSKHNPWNEVECGDHYARAMASYGVFLGLCGFEYHGPQNRLGFAPRITPEDFRAAFTAAEGWGTISQQRSEGGQENRIELRWGKLKVETLVFEIPEGRKATGARLTEPATEAPEGFTQEGCRVTIKLAKPIWLAKLPELAKPIELSPPEIIGVAISY